MNGDRVIRWGIIGCGDVVETKNGAPMYLADHSELVGIWNRTKEKAIRWCERHGHGRAFDSLDELLNDPDIDIIYVATTPNMHKEYACAVAASGMKPRRFEQPSRRVAHVASLLTIVAGCRVTRS